MPATTTSKTSFDIIDLTKWISEIEQSRQSIFSKSLYLIITHTIERNQLKLYKTSHVNLLLSNFLGKCEHENIYTQSENLDVETKFEKNGSVWALLEA